MENNVRAVERALQLLNCFEDGRESFSLSEISQKVGLSPTTALRLLATLESQNYIYKSSENSRYYLGFQLARLSHVAFANLSVTELSKQELERLSNLFREGTGIFIRRGCQRICVSRIEGKGGLRSFIQVGNSSPLTRGASGLVLLSDLPHDKIVENLETDPLHSLEDVLKVKEQGYAISHGERQKGVISISAPIYNSLGKVEAAIFISAASSALTEEKIQEVVEEVIQSGKNISILLGYKE